MADTLRPWLRKATESYLELRQYNLSFNLDATGLLQLIQFHGENGGDGPRIWAKAHDKDASALLCFDQAALDDFKSSHQQPITAYSGGLFRIDEACLRLSTEYPDAFRAGQGPSSRPERLFLFVSKLAYISSKGESSFAGSCQDLTDCFKSWVRDFKIRQARRNAYKAVAAYHETQMMPPPDHLVFSQLVAPPVQQATSPPAAARDPTPASIRSDQTVGPLRSIAGTEGRSPSKTPRSAPLRSSASEILTFDYTQAASSTPPPPPQSNATSTGTSPNAYDRTLPPPIRVPDVSLSSKPVTEAVPSESTQIGVDLGRGHETQAGIEASAVSAISPKSLHAPAAMLKSVDAIQSSELEPPVVVTSNTPDRLSVSASVTASARGHGASRSPAEMSTGRNESLTAAPPILRKRNLRRSALPSSPASDLTEIAPIKKIDVISKGSPLPGPEPRQQATHSNTGASSPDRVMASQAATALTLLRDSPVDSVRSVEPAVRPESTSPDSAHEEPRLSGWTLKAESATPKGLGDISALIGEEIGRLKRSINHVREELRQLEQETSLHLLPVQPSSRRRASSVRHDDKEDIARLARNLLFGDSSSDAELVDDDSEAMPPNSSISRTRRLDHPSVQESRSASLRSRDTSILFESSYSQKQLDRFLQNDANPVTNDLPEDKGLRPFPSSSSIASRSTVMKDYMEDVSRDRIVAEPSSLPSTRPPARSPFPEAGPSTRRLTSSELPMRVLRNSELPQPPSPEQSAIHAYEAAPRTTKMANLDKRRRTSMEVSTSERSTSEQHKRPRISGMSPADTSRKFSSSRAASGSSRGVSRVQAGLRAEDRGTASPVARPSPTMQTSALSKAERDSMKAEVARGVKTHLMDPMPGMTAAEGLGLWYCCSGDWAAALIIAQYVRLHGPLDPDQDLHTFPLDVRAAAKACWSPDDDRVALREISHRKVRAITREKVERKRGAGSLEHRRAFLKENYVAAQLRHAQPVRYPYDQPTRG